MAYSTTNLYPEDLNGTNPANLITNEPQTLQSPGPYDFYFIIPKAAPFFVDSLRVVNAATGQPYVEGTDYQIGHQFVEAMASIGRPIAGSIRFMRPTIVGQVLLTYRTLGGPWGFSDQDILRELANKLVNPLIRSWGDIAPLPYSFPPLPHNQKIDTLIGSVQINASINRIADVLEATASGSTASHISNFNNPHRVTKLQVGLGNVPNFAMATDQQHINANQSDLFTNPRGVLLLVNTYAVAPLNAHIANASNPHRVDKQQVGLGNVPNFAKATPAQAVDPTNDSTLMTPYTTTLLVQRLAADPRLDQLILDFNDHITANNPHNITALSINTYTAPQIDQMLADIGQNSDAATFNGESPEQWVSKFPSVADINQILQELYEVVQLASTDMSLLDVSNPVSDADQNLNEARKLSWSFGDYEAYALYNALGDGIIVPGSSVGTGYPTGAMEDMPGKWGTTVSGNYYIEPNGGIRAWGTNPINIPTAYRYTNANPIEVVSIFPSKDFVVAWLEDGRLVNFPRGLADTGVPSAVAAGATVVNCYVSNGMKDSRFMGVYEEDTTGAWIPIGNSSWVNAAQTVIDAGNAGGYSVIDMRISTDNVVVIAQSTTDSIMKVYRINYAEFITLTDITATVDVRNHTTGEVIKANLVRGITQVAGSFTHTVLTKPIAPGEELCDLLSFGDNSNGQLEIPASSAPFYSIGAGYGFTVTVNRHNFAEFWGDSPDNSLLYRGGPNLVVE